MEHGHEVREHEVSTEPRGFSGVVWVSWMFAGYLLDTLIHGTAANARIVWRELDLFFGAALFLLGLFGFSTGRYCDGNTAEYLSCTRPAVYYYFDTLHIALIMFGVVFMLLWFQKNRRSE